MKLRIIQFLFLLAFIPIPLTAYFHMESTFSGGYYRDIDKDAHVPAYFYWNFNQAHRSGVEISIHSGVNNDVVFETWRFFLYHATLALPYKTFRADLGRQFFSEGFEAGMLDGAQARYDWSDDGGLWCAGGGLHSLEQTDIDFKTQLYGLALHQKILTALWKVGYFFNVRDKKENLHLIHGAVMKEWQNFIFKPSFLVKGQVNPEESALTQITSEVRLHPSESTVFTFDFLSQRRNHLLPDDGEFIYGLFSSSAQKTFHTSLTWLPSSHFQAELGGWRSYYDSRRGEESVNRAMLSTSWQWGLYDLNLSLGRMHSYGGRVWHGGGYLKKALKEWADIQIEGSVAYIDKINSINTWAYHVRGGMSFKIAPKLILSALAEVERNHRFEFDTRGIVYVSHYFY